MVPPSHADRTRKEEYFEILDETIRTNPYRKATTAMASVMNKHGITSDASNVLGKPSLGLPEKKCALTRALRLAQNCNQKLNVTKNELQSLCCDLGAVKPEKFSADREKAEPPSTAASESPSDRAVMTGHLLTLIGEAQTIAKRIYETAVGLHVAEDYLRQPDDLKLLDFSVAGRIQIPNYNFNHASQLCLEWLHSTAIKWLRGFKEDGGDENIQFIKVFDNFTKAVRDYTEAVCLANQVFRVLLYPNKFGKQNLQEYVLSLGHVLKNDIMMEVQSLRRAFDSIQYSFERLGWAASIAWMKYSGKNITVETLNENGIQVDHSVFQHKFFEGPSKLVKTSKTNSKNANDTGSAKTDETQEQNTLLDSEPNLVRPKSKKKLSSTVQEKREKTPRNEESPKSLLQVDNSIESRSRPTSRMSQSAPEVSKSKKPLKQKGRTQQVDQLFTRTAVADLPSESGDDSNTRLNLLKLLKNDRAYQASSQSTIDSMTGSKATPLTLAPNIPAAWRKQFGAVFGKHLVPPKAKTTRKTKKKAGTVAGASQKQTKKLGAI